jgi:hypothetical protein
MWHKLSGIIIKNIIKLPVIYAFRGTAICQALLVITSFFPSLVWLTVTFAILAGLMTLITSFLYIYTLFKNPDALRSKDEFGVKK